MNFSIVEPGPAGTNVICIEDEHEAMRIKAAMTREWGGIYEKD